MAELSSRKLIRNAAKIYRYSATSSSNNFGKNLLRSEYDDLRIGL